MAPKPFQTLTYTDGRPPRTAAEASIDDSTADREGLEIGDTLRIAGQAGVKAYRIVGLQRLGETSGGGSGTAQLTLPEAQAITDKRGELDGISVKAAPGVSPRELRTRIDEVLPPRLVVETGTQAAARQAQDIKDDLSFFRVVLLVFGGVALLVGSFLIFNIFSITVAQRIREFGMLRTLGASRRQILGGTILEALFLGILGAGLGVPAGIGFAAALNGIFKSFGIDLPNTGTVIETRTIVVALVVGVGVTLASALVPAVRATRVSPMAALREAELPESRTRGRDLHGVRAAAVRDRHRHDLRRPLRRHRRREHGRRAGGRRRGGHAVRRLDVQPAARAPARLLHRLAAREAARPHGPARAREHGAQARPHRRDRGRLDDRAGGGGVRDHVRGRNQRLGGQRDRPQLPGRHRPAEHRRLLADQPRARAAPRRRRRA